MNTKPSICLNMIVKNESRVIRRLLASVEHFVTRYTIVDTGSTDDTISIIKSQMLEYGVRGTVHERPWVNFGANRQQALDLAIEENERERRVGLDFCSHILFIDADEELGFSYPLIPFTLTPGVSYNIEKHHSGIRYALPQLIDITKSTWQWKGVVHNYLVQLTGPAIKEVRKDIWIIYHPGEGAKSHGLTSEQKYMKDANLLLEELRKNPDDPRSQFYLAQSYKHAGHYQQALPAYLVRTRMKGWLEETYMAMVEVGRVSILLKLPEETIVSAFLHAFNFHPTRAEPLYELARYFRLKKQYGKAYLFAKVGSDIPKPNDRLFVAQDVYDWKIYDELSIAAYYIKNYTVSNSASRYLMHLLQQGMEIPLKDVMRIKENLRFSEAKVDYSHE